MFRTVPSVIIVFIRWSEEEVCLITFAVKSIKVY